MVKVRQLIWAAVLSCVASAARGAVPLEEDLSGCKLANGISILPIPHSTAAANGELLKLSTGAMSSFPTPTAGQMESQEQIMERLRANKTADLEYLPDNEGTFWAVSGAISDLGFAYLTEAAAGKFDPPMEIRATSRSAAGMLSGIAEGHTYLLKTADSKFALLRVLEKGPYGVVIQYAYQPMGSLVFDVPAGEKLKYQRPGGGLVAPAPATEPATGGPGPLASLNPEPPANTLPAIPPRAITTLPAPLPRPALGPGDVNQPGVIRLLNTGPAPGGGSGTGSTAGTGAGTGAVAMGPDPSLEAFTRERDLLIKRRLAVVEAPAHNATEVERKAQAIVDLANLHADEAADTLVKQIVFLNAASTAKEFTQEAFHPSVAALHSLGKSGSIAAIKGLKELDVDAVVDGLDSPGYRAELLGIVVRDVEGNELGNYILRQEMEKETDPRRRALYERALKQKT